MTTITESGNSPASIAANIHYQLTHLQDSRGWEVITLNVVMVTLSTIAVVLRLVARRVVSVPLSWDDFLIIFALAASYALTVSAVLMVHYGFGKHVFASSFQKIEACLKAVYVYLVIYTICLPVVKISILIFYVRIFSTRRFKQLAYTLIIFSAMWSISAFWVAVFQCSPVKAFWDKSIDGKCINSFDWLMAEGGITILTDIALLVMPMPMVWKLKISQQQKIALSGVFLLGGLVCVASIVRMPTLNKLFTIDSTWTAYTPQMWSVVEANVCIICACLPIMRPLFYRSSIPTNEERYSQWAGVKATDSQIMRDLSSSSNSAIDRDYSTFKAYQHLGISPNDPWHQHIRMIREAGDAKIAAAIQKTRNSLLFHRESSEDHDIERRSDSLFRAGSTSDDMDLGAIEKSVHVQVSTTTLRDDEDTRRSSAMGSS